MCDTQASIKKINIKKKKQLSIYVISFKNKEKKENEE
jgi:hypothetical protein